MAAAIKKVEKRAASSAVPKPENLLEADKAKIVEMFLTNKDTIPKLYEFIFRKDLPV